MIMKETLNKIPSNLEIKTESKLSAFLLDDYFIIYLDIDHKRIGFLN